MVLPAEKSSRRRMAATETVSPTGENQMGLVYAEIELISVDDTALFSRGYLAENEIKRVRVNALVDSGSYMLVIPNHVKEQLGLRVLGERMAILANELEVRGTVVGPVEVRFENRRTTVDAVVLSDQGEVLLGSVPMEDLDVLIDPKRQKLIVNPDYPNIPLTYAK
jgi:clan AA aspartic protease